MPGKFCPFCGNPLRAGAKFCPRCGEAQRIRPSLPSQSWVQRLLSRLRRFPRLHLRLSRSVLLVLLVLLVFCCVLVIILKAPSNLGAPMAILETWATQRAEEGMVLTPIPGDLFPPVRGDLTAAQQQAYDLLSDESLETPAVRVVEGAARFTTLNLEVPDSVAVDVEEKASYFLATHADLFQLTDVEQNLEVAEVITDDFGGQHVWMSQSNDGIPIYGSSVGVHFSPDGQIELVNGGYLPGEFHPPDPSIADQDAEHIALHQGAYPGGEIYLPATSMILSPKVFGEVGDARLIWFVQIGFSGVPVVDYLVDAQNGEIIAEISHLRDALDLEIRDMQRQADWNSGMVQINEGGPLSDVTPAPEALLVRDHILVIYDFWNDFLGRRNWDNRDGQIGIGINYYLPRDCSIACWHPRDYKIYYRHGNQPEFDITAHEFTHAVVDSTVGLKYKGQSGGLNESFADVFAALIEAYNPDENQFDSHSDWMIVGRNMTDPRRSSPPQPAEYSDEVEQCRNSKCVHSIAGVPNLAAYFLVVGGEKNGIAISGIGYVKVARLYYAVLSNGLLASNANFMDARDAIVETCQSLVENNEFGFEFRDCVQVVNAFAAVGLGNPFTLVSSPPPDAVVVDDQSPEFTRQGEISNWKEATTGYRDHFYWIQSDQADVDDLAIWDLSSGKPGDYDLYVYIPETHSTANNTHYLINHFGESSEVIVDQNAHQNEWLHLGSYTFCGRESENLQITDLSSGTSGSEVAVDAMAYINQSGFADGLGKRFDCWQQEISDQAKQKWEELKQAVADWINEQLDRLWQSILDWIEMQIQNMIDQLEQQLTEWLNQICLQICGLALWPIGVGWGIKRWFSRYRLKQRY